MKRHILMCSIALVLGISLLSYGYPAQIIGSAPEGVKKTAQIIGPEPHSPVNTI